MAVKPVSKGLPWAWAAIGAKMRNTTRIGADFADAKVIIKQVPKGCLTGDVCGMTPSNSNHQSRCIGPTLVGKSCVSPMTSQPSTIPYAYSEDLVSRYSVHTDSLLGFIRFSSK